MFRIALCEHVLTNLSVIHDKAYCIFKLTRLYELLLLYKINNKLEVQSLNKTGNELKWFISGFIQWLHSNLLLILFKLITIFKVKYSHIIFTVPTIIQYTSYIK